MLGVNAPPEEVIMVNTTCKGASIRFHFKFWKYTAFCCSPVLVTRNAQFVRLCLSIQARGIPTPTCQLFVRSQNSHSLTPPSSTSSPLFHIIWNYLQEDILESDLCFGLPDLCFDSTLFTLAHFSNQINHEEHKMKFRQIQLVKILIVCVIMSQSVERIAFMTRINHSICKK